MLEPHDESASMPEPLDQSASVLELEPPLMCRCDNQRLAIILLVLLAKPQKLFCVTASNSLKSASLKSLGEQTDHSQQVIRSKSNNGKY